MKIELYYCPKCKQFPDHLIERRAKIYNHDTRMPEKELEPIDELCLGVKCPLCDELISKTRSAHDFQIVFDASGKIIKKGRYFIEHPEPLRTTTAFQAAREKLLDQLFSFITKKIRPLTHEEAWIIKQLLLHPIEHHHKVKERDRIPTILNELKRRLESEG